VLQLGLPDLFTDHGDPVKLLASCGLDGEGIAKSIRERFVNNAVESDAGKLTKRVA
jgi:1-deoxy-D-xylulose-5-phosphate synthase